MDEAAVSRRAFLDLLSEAVRASDATVAMSTASTPSLLADLPEDGRALVLATGPWPHLSPGLAATLLGQEALVALVPACSPLAVGDWLDLAEWGEEALVTLRPDSALAHQSAAAFERAGVTPPRILGVDSIEMAGLVASAGLGAAVVPQGWVDLLGGPGMDDVRVRRLADPQAIVEEWLVHRPGADPVLEKLVEAVGQRCGVARGIAVADHTDRGW